MFTLQFSLIAVLAMFLLFGCSTSSITTEPSVKTSETQVTIKRDRYGAPHIYADTAYGLFYGYGYAVAQDRLFQMEMTKRTVTGTVSEVMGSEYLEVDKAVRQGYEPGSIHRQIAALSKEHLDVLEGYAAGYNRWLEEVKRDVKTLTPKEFLDYGFNPSRLSAYDVAMIFAGTMAYRFADFNEELNNLAFYQDLRKQHGEKEAWKLFNTVQPLYDNTSPTTVPEHQNAQSGSFSDPSRPPHYLSSDTITPPVRLAKDGHGRHLSFGSEVERSDYLRDEYAISGNSGIAGFPSTSNVWLANKHKIQDAEAVLVNGPQFGWMNPSYSYSVGLHGAGWEVVGNTMLAYPALFFAHNSQIGWGSTAGFGDLVDIFELQLNPENPDQYFYQGSYHDFDQREAAIKIKDQQAESVTFYRSIHGPVVHHDAQSGLAYSKKRSWEGLELETMMAWVDMPKATNFNQWRDYVSRMATNINFYYLDQAGNIAYIHTGKYPVRHSEHDNRLPARGDGSMNWESWLAFDKNPSVLNPEEGYIQNWNNRPARGWPSMDAWWKNWARVDRAGAIIAELESQDSFTVEQLWDINSRTSFADVNVAYLLPYLQDAVAQEDTSDLVQAALIELESWDKYWWDKDSDGYFDNAGPTIMDAWLKRLLQTAFADDIGEEFLFRFTSPGYPTGRILGAVGASPGIKALVRIMDQHKKGQITGFDLFNGVEPNQILAETFTETVNDLQSSYGSSLEQWRVKPHPHVFGINNFQGVPQNTPDNELSLPVTMNRGTENNLFVATGSRITGSDVTPPGQSGFISPDGARDPHYADQMSLYQQFERKPLPFDASEVTDMMEESITLTFTR